MQSRFNCIARGEGIDNDLTCVILEILIYYNKIFVGITVGWLVDIDRSARCIQDGLADG